MPRRRSRRPGSRGDRGGDRPRLGGPEAAVAVAAWGCFAVVVSIVTALVLDPSLWDTVLGFGALALLGVGAAALVTWRATSLLGAVATLVQPTPLPRDPRGARERRRSDLD